MSLATLNPDVVIIAKVSAVLFATGYGMIGVLSLIPATAKGARASWPSAFSAALSFSAVLAVFLLGGTILGIALVIAAARIAYEAVLVGFGPFENARAVAYGAAGLMAATAGGVLMLPLADVAYWVTVIFAGTAVVRLLAGKAARGEVKTLLSLLLYPVLPVLMFIAAANTTAFGALILASYVLVETFDSYALLGGKALGKTKAFPKLSPRKTVEGLVFGALMLIVTVAVITSIYRPQDLWIAIGIAVVTGVLSLIGDLVASRIKRAGGVKDFPPVLKQQGGLLDIADAWIATGAGIALIMMALGI